MSVRTMNDAFGRWEITHNCDIFHTTENVPDKRWLYVDCEGHKHRWWRGFVTNTERIETGVDEDGDSYGELRCKKCGEEIYPHYRQVERARQGNQWLEGWFYCKRDIGFLIKKKIRIQTWMPAAKIIGKAVITNIEFGYPDQFISKPNHTVFFKSIGPWRVVE